MAIEIHGDLVKSGSNLFSRLIPDGGTLGQVVVKGVTAPEWGDPASGGGTNIYVGPLPPPSPVDGQLWVQTI